MHDSTSSSFKVESLSNTSSTCTSSTPSVTRTMNERL